MKIEHHKPESDIYKKNIENQNSIRRNRGQFSAFHKDNGQSGDPQTERPGCSAFTGHLTGQRIEGLRVAKSE